MKCPQIYEAKITISKVNLEVINRWVTERITEILGFEDGDGMFFEFFQPDVLTLSADICVGTAINYISMNPKPDPKKLQLDLTGFLEKQVYIFKIL